MQLKRVAKNLKKRYYFRRADVHILSFPKCRRTWVRLMLGAVLERHFGIACSNVQLHKVADRRHGIPCVLSTHDCRTRPDAEGRFRFEHDKTRFEGRRVLLLVRDPRDVTISNYYGRKYRAKQKFEGTISEFVRHAIWGVGAVVSYYNTWADNRCVPG